MAGITIMTHSTAMVATSGAELEVDAWLGQLDRETGKVVVRVRLACS